MINSKLTCCLLDLAKIVSKQLGIHYLALFLFFFNVRLFNNRLNFSFYFFVV